MCGTFFQLAILKELYFKAFFSFIFAWVLQGKIPSWTFLTDSSLPPHKTYMVKLN